MFFRFSYFTPKLDCFLCIWLLVCPCAFSTNLLVEFAFIFFNIPICLYCWILSQYLLNFLSFTKIFCFISSSCIFRLFSCSVLVFSFQHPRMLFLPKHFHLLLQFLYQSFQPNFPFRFCIFI